MNGEITKFLGTRRWLPQILGSWTKKDVTVKVISKHQLPKEIIDGVPEKWNSLMRMIGEQELGEENKDWRIVPAKPYAKMEVKKEDGWHLKMFPGDQTRIESYDVDKNGKLKLIHSPANYAESLATNNTNPWSLIMKYGGRKGLADGHAVSVAVTGLDVGGREMMQFFRRGPGMGEYSLHIGTAAGNSMKPDLEPFDIASRELMEESRIMPFLAAYKNLLYESGVLFSDLEVNEYKRIGLSNSKFENVETIEGGNKVRFLDRKGNESRGLLVDKKTNLTLTGLALNVDADEYDSLGHNKPHHKSEYLFLLRTQLSLEDLNNEQFGWVRNDEHSDVLYVPFTLDNLTEFAVENFNQMMPPTNAVILTAIKDVFGFQNYQYTVDAINQKYPLTKEHPFMKVVNANKYSHPPVLIDSKIFTISDMNYFLK
ncbi:MAG: hypothetical protein ABIC91_08230 [Nanoarchaeota archaeon]|nr:hypothetical protein [Nanoarchaeota archaeon]MBU1031074.1 hypothetical protein [Nanoarchaeota archaeon]MBU1850497.1 hypothetical protein [Nanoarchaeota archaeon]